MDNLLHWDFAVNFTGAQAAALIFGMDLNSVNASLARNDTLEATYAKYPPALERMRQCYELARKFHYDSLRPPRDWDGVRPANMLESTEMLERLCGLDFDLDHHFCSWLRDDSYSGFDNQRFTRTEISGWLIGIGQRSAYLFDPKHPEAYSPKLTPGPPPSAAITKPLNGRQTTTFLNIIGALLELIHSPRPGRDSEASVIRELLDNYSEKPGISKRTLEDKFADAKRSLRMV